jgi:hypothetical protein
VARAEGEPVTNDEAALPGRPANVTAARVPRGPAVLELASRANRAFGQFELALIDLEACTPRGDHLAGVLVVASERFRRHHFEPYKAIVEEWTA